MAAWSMPTGTHARAEGPRHHRRTAGPTGAHPGWKWSWEYVHPFGTFGTARTKHAVVMVEGAIVPADCRAGEEDNRHDENSAGDDHYPRRNLVKPRRSRCVGRRRRRAGRWGLNLGLRCLGHPSIMPTCAPAIKHRARGVASGFSAGTADQAEVPTVLVAQEPGKTQNDHRNEHDSRNDRHPGRCLVKPLRMFLRRHDRRRRDGRRRGRRLRCLAHAS